MVAVGQVRMEGRVCCPNLQYRGCAWGKWRLPSDIQKAHMPSLSCDLAAPSWGVAFDAIDHVTRPSNVVPQNPVLSSHSPQVKSLPPLESYCDVESG